MFVFVTRPELELGAAVVASGQDLDERGAVALDTGDGIGGSGRRRISRVNREGHLRGVRPGMPVGAAVDLCPELRLLRPDPVGAARIWEEELLRIEGIGAEVESSEVGEAYFDPAGLLRLYGGINGVLEGLFEALGDRCLVGVGPTRLASTIDLGRSAGNVRIMRPEEMGTRLDPLGLDRLRGRLGIEPDSEDELIGSLRRLGIGRLGDLKMLGRDSVADRFGRSGIRAWEISSGRDVPLRPRRPMEAPGVTVEIPDEGSSIGLSPALALASSGLSARLESLGRVARSVRLEAELGEGGSWHCDRSPKVPTSNSDLIRMLFEPSLERIPGMPSGLRLVALALTEGSPARATLFEGASESRRRKLDEAVRQVRAAVGEPGLLKVVETNPRSRIPERRVILVPCDRAAGAGR